MDAGYGFSPLSDEEIWEIAQALQEVDATSRDGTVSETELREIINALRETTLCDTAGRINEQDKRMENPIENITVTGESRSGKATFLNVIPGLDDNEFEGAAKTGVVETTKYPSDYPHPQNFSKMDSLETFHIISTEEVEEIKAALEEGDLCSATEKLSRSLREIENAPLNIAVTGESGSGKSTFVNAIRGMDNDEEKGAAKTGVTETTMEPKPYPHPDYFNVTFWDLPGIGSPNFNPNDYLKAVNFHQYDFFIIMSSERFRHNDMELAKEIKSMGKKFYFVRSKVDSDLHASQIRRKKSYNEENVLREIRNDCIQCLNDGGIQDPKVFLLSSLDFNKFDFNQMQETLEQELPSQKRHVFMLCLPNISRPILEKKRKALRKHIWKWATLSCAVAAVPIPGLSVACDIGILVREMRKYQKAFGLDQRSLEKLANRFDKDVKELKSVIRSPIVLKEINKELVTTFLTRGAVGALVLVEYLTSTIPVIGTVVAGGMSFGTTYYMLYHFFKDIADDAVRVLLKALESPV
ncbi:interferon-inducible GTPase 5-like isoform X1 [Aquarana catesbeiana]|uniref:interferon-inducible GTPase 5-like isoform X1 n=1 Tax=Aquarana catesbeiana TaxID=8400 RepID=UPI003CC9AA6E